MNAIYKVIWNDALRIYQVVNEMCRSRRKACSVKCVHGSPAPTLRRTAYIAGSALAFFAASMHPAWAADYTFKGSVDLAGGSYGVESVADTSELPSGDEAYRFTYDQFSFSNASGIASFDDSLNSSKVGDLVHFEQFTTFPNGRIEVTGLPDGSSYDSSVAGSRFLYRSENVADFYFKLGTSANLPDTGAGSILLNRQLTRVNLLGNLSVEAGAQSPNASVDNWTDLSAALTGGGNINFVFNGTEADVGMGYLYLNNFGEKEVPDLLDDEKASIYTGQTQVGGDGAKAVTVVFGKDNAFGYTSNLNVRADSEVWFADWQKNVHHEQTVGGLQGEGLLDFGVGEAANQAAEVTLAQQSDDVGNVYVDGAGESFIGIDNVMTGSGGAVFNIEFADVVEGAEVLFTNAGSDYKGLITIQDAALTAYNADRTLTVTKDGEETTFKNFNSILNSDARFQLLGGSELRVEDTGSVKNLIITGAEGSAAGLSFSSVGFTNEALLTIGNLDLQQSETVVDIESFADDLEDAGDAFASGSFLDADEGLSSALIEVTEEFTSGQGTAFKVGGAAADEVKTSLGDEADPTADLYWNFDEYLRREDDAEGHSTFYADYRLTKVDVKNDKNFELAAKEDTADQSTFTAEITGSGGLVIDASGKEVLLGNTTEGANANSYQGATEVTQGTKVTLVADSAMGQTSGLRNEGALKLESGVSQTVKDLTGSGSIDLASDSEFFLDRDAAKGGITVSNTLTGTGTFRVDLGSNANELVFSGAQTGFGGTLSLSNTSFDLGEGLNQTVASGAHVVLGDSGSLTISGDAHLGALTVGAGAEDLKVDNLVIGGKPSLSLENGLTLEGETTFDITKASVAENADLLSFDRAQAGDAGASQDFVATASGGISAPSGAHLDVTGADGYANGELVLGYTQNGQTVAQTHWTVADALTGDADSLNAQILLTGIDVTGTLAFGAGQSGGLSAAITSQGDSAVLSFTDGAAITVSGTNSYAGAVSLEGENTALTLASGLGGTLSSLSVGEGSTFALNGNVVQATSALSGTGTISLASGSTLSLLQTGNAAVANAFDGAGTFAADLAGGTLAFTSSVAMGGRLALTNTILTLADAGNQTVLETATVRLGTDSRLETDDESTIAGLEFSGGTVSLPTLAAGSDAPLNVTGGVDFTGGGQIELEGLQVAGTESLFNAFDLDQALIHFSGSPAGSVADIAFAGKASGEIWNDGAAPGTDPAAAYGVWTKDGNLFIDGQNVEVHLKLTELQLALDNGTGLVIDASKADGQTITAAIKDHNGTAGDLTFSGAGTVSIGGTSINDYTGETHVLSDARVELEKENALGATSLLAVSGGTVDLNANALRVGSLNLQTAGALEGSGTLTLTGAGGSSVVAADNTGFTGDVRLTGGHTLTLQTAGGLGANQAFVEFGSTNDALRLDGVAGADGAFAQFGKTLSGDGSLEVVSGSRVELTGYNGSGGFTGLIDIDASSTVLAQGSVDEKLGSGAAVKVEGELQLTDSGNWSIDETLEGSGRVSITGLGEGSSFSFLTTAADPSAFTGEVAFSAVKFAVGGSNAANTANMTHADARFGAGSTLVVAAGGETKTFNDLTLSGGSVAFGGTLGFNAAADELGTLTIDGTLHLLEDTTLEVTIGTGDDMLAGSVAESDLLTAEKGLNPFEALITADAIDGTGEVSLSTGNGSGAKQDIRNGTGDVVAYGIYDYKAALNDEDNPTQVGVAYDLTEVDIVGGKTLTLTGSTDETAPAELAVKLSESGGSGSLAVDSGYVLLSSAENDYSGSTTIESGASLAALADALGETSNLVVKGTYANLGENAADHLAVEASGTLDLAEKLTVEQDADGDSSIAGVLTGSGALVFNDGTLTIEESAKGESFFGRIVAGNDSAAQAKLTIESLGAVNHASALVFGNADSTIDFDLNGSGASFASQIEGMGTIEADADFVFGNEQTALESGSIFELTGTGVYDLSKGANAYAGEKLDFIVNAGTTLANPDGATRNVYGLQLAGGTLDFGAVTHSGGQIHVGAGDLELEGKTTVAFDTEDGQLSSVSVSDDGHELLAAGEVFSLDLITGLSGQSFTDAELNEHLQLGEDFDDTTDVVTQDIDEGGESEVAILTRGSGTFHMSENGDAVEVGYNYRELELIYGDEAGEKADKGLVVTNTGSGSSRLSAHIVGTGNLDLAGGQISIGYLNEDASDAAGRFNSYTGSTFVRDGAVVTISESSGMGETKRLVVEDGASVTLAAGKSQTVHGLEGKGDLRLGSDSVFFIDWTDAGAHVVTNNIASADGASGGKLLMDGEGGSIAFEAAQDLAGLDLFVQNGALAFGNSTGDATYGTVSSADRFVLGTDAALTVNAGESGYGLNELVFGGFDATGTLTGASGGSLGFTNVSLSTEAGSDAVLHVDKLVVGAGGGSLSASAKIGSDFDVLKNDVTEYRSTLIAFDDYEGDLEALKAEAGDLDPSAIQNAGGSTVAYAAWQTNGVETKVSADDRSGTIGLAFQVSEIQLAAEGDAEGLVLDATGASGADATLSVRLTDYTDEAGTTHAGNITFAGGDITIENSGKASDYTGKTFVKGGSVTLAVDDGFGRTSLMRVEAGAKVDLGSQSQIFGSLEILGEGGLAGDASSSLTLGFEGESKTSVVSGANAQFAGSVSLTSGHRAEVLNAEGFGAAGSAGLVTVNDGAELALGFSGAFSNALAGAGTVEIGLAGDEPVAGDVTLSEANAGFAGTFDVLDGSSLTIAAGAASAQKILGSGSVALEGSGSELNLTASTGNISIANEITGAGTVTATGSGAENSTLEWTASWAEPNFTGELILNDIAMAVGTADGTNAFHTAHNLAQADVTLASGTRLDVLTGAQAVDTFDALTIDGGTIAFGGTFDFGAGSNALGQLTVGSLVIGESGGNIVLSGMSGNDPTLSGSVNEADLLSDAQDVFQTLIHTDAGGLTDADLDGLTVNGGSPDLSGTKAIENASGTTVAIGHYDFGLDVSEDGHDLGVSFGLTQLDLVKGETLTLTGAADGEAELSAAITSGGSLAIGSGAVHLLQNDGTNYTGETHVLADASLTADKGAIGDTSLLKLESGAGFTAAGDNKAHGLSAASGATLTIEDGVTFTLDQAASTQSSLAGTLVGSGTLAVSSGSLEVTGSNRGFTGISTAKNGAEIVMKTADALGTGVTRVESGSTLSVDIDATSGATQTVTLANRVSGEGVVKVDLADADQNFSFADAQTSGAFTGTIELTNAGFSLAYAEDGDPRDDYTANQLAAANAHIVAGANSNLYVSTNTHPTNRFYDKRIGSLTLDGGNIYFGGLRYGAGQETDAGGQLVLQGSGMGANDAVLDIAGQSTVHLGDGATNELSSSGHELLLADDGTQIDIIQNADDIRVEGSSVVAGGDLDAASSAVDGKLDLALHVDDAKQIVTQRQDDGSSLQVATVVREFGTNNRDGIFGVSEGSADGKYDVYLNYRVDEIHLTYGDDADETGDLGLVISSTASETGADRATLTAQLTGGGNVIFAGEGEILLGRADASADDANDYTGKTWVNGGTIIFAEDNAFGASTVTVAEGATVDLNGHAQTLPSLTADAGTLSGGGAYTLTGSGETSTVAGDNPDFYGDFTVSGGDAGHTLRIESIGALGSASGGEAPELTLAGEQDKLKAAGVSGAFTEVVKGEGEVALVEGSSMTIAADNSAFTGTWSAAAGTSLTASGASSGLSISELLGGADLRLESGASASLSEDGGWTLSNAVAGEGGELRIDAAGGSFGFAAADTTAGYAGAFVFTNAELAVGGSSAGHVAENLQGNHSTLGAGAKLTVDGAAMVGSLTLGESGSITFTEAFTPGETEWNSLLTVDGDLHLDGGTIAIKTDGLVNPLPGTDNAPLQSTDILGADRYEQYVTIAETTNGTVNGTASVTVNGDEGKAVVKIQGADGQAVADGTYGFNVQTSEDKTELQLGYGLSEVAVYGGETLELAGSTAEGADNVLTAKVTDSKAEATSGSGGIRITSGEVVLASSENDYTGATEVAAGATLGAEKGALGQTSDLVLEGDDAAFENRGDNTVRGIHAESGSAMTLTGSLTAHLNGGTASYIRGAITGGGKLSAHSADGTTLAIEGSNTGWTGGLDISGAAVTADHIESLGTGDVTVASGESGKGSLTMALERDAAGTGYKLANGLTGDGDVTIEIAADGTGSNAFAFSNEAGEHLTGTVTLTGVDLSLTQADHGNRNALAAATLALGAGSTLHVSDSFVSAGDYDFHDRYLGGLVLAGDSRIEFGGLLYGQAARDEEMGGQINLAQSGGGFGTVDLSTMAEGEKAEVLFKEGATSTISADGSEVLSAVQGAQIALIESAGDILGRGGAKVSGGDDINLDEYLKLDFENSDAVQTIRQARGDGYVKVARATREYRDADGSVFGYEALENGTYDIYANYRVTAIELIDTTEGEGLRVVNDEADAASLEIVMTGEGNIVLGGGILFGNERNAYKGETIVESGVVTAAADRAFGDSEALVVKEGAQVDLDGTTQRVGRVETHSANALTGGGSLTIGFAGESGASVIEGANAGLTASIGITAGHTATLNDARGLGSGSLALDGALRFEDTPERSELTNVISGAGSVTAGAAGSILVSQKNESFTGSWTAEAGGTIRFDDGAGGAVSDLIGGASLEAQEGGTIELVQAGGADGRLEFSNIVTGEGTLHLEASGEQAELHLGDAQKDFAGHYEFGNVSVDLNENGTALANAESSTFQKDSELHVAEGESSLSTDVTIESGAALVYDGPLTPGSHDETNPDHAASHLTVDNLTLEAGSEVRIDVSTVPVDPSGGPTNDALSSQDVMDLDNGTNVSIIASAQDGGKIVDLGATLVDKDGNALSFSSVELDIVNTGDDPDHVSAVGHYGLGLDTNGKDLELAYKLTQIDLKDGEELKLALDEDDDGRLSALVTSGGSLRLEKGDLTLTNGGNSYTGATIVDGSGAHLTANAGGLGETSSLDVVNGTYTNAGKNAAGGIRVSESGVLDLSEGTLTVNDTDAVDSVISGSITGSGGFAVGSGDVTVETSNAGYTGAVSVADGAHLTVKAGDALGASTTITVEGVYEIDGVGSTGSSADVGNAFAGAGTIALTNSNVTLTGDNTAFNGGEFVLSESDLTVNSAKALGLNTNVRGEAAGGSTLHLDFADAADLGTTTASGTLDAEKTGAGALSMKGFAADGTFTVKDGSVAFGSFGSSTSSSTLVVADGKSASVASDSWFDSLTLGAGSVFTASGDSAMKLTVAGTTSVGSGELHLGASGDDLKADAIGTVLETEDFTIDGGEIFLSGMLETGGWTVDRIVVNGTGSGSGTITVNMLEGDSGTVRADAWLVQAGEGGSLADLDLTLGNEDGVILAGGYEYHLLEAEGGRGYYLHAFKPGTGHIDGDEIREPGAGAEAALLMAAQQAFDLSLHDHVGTTHYVDQLTGERKLTSFWMFQRGDWAEWDDMSGQLSTDGKVMTTHMGGDLTSWVSDANQHVRLGLLAGYANADYDVDSSLDGRSATGEFTGWSVGAYAAFAPAGSGDGPFGSVQLRWNRFSNEVSVKGLGKHEYTSDGFSIQGELGWTKTLSTFQTFGGKTGFWRIEPHVRVHWNGVEADAARDDSGSRYTVTGDGNIQVRVGARTVVDVTHSLHPTFGDPTVRAYLEANYLRNTKQVSATMESEFRTTTVEYDNSDMAEFRFGLEGQFNRNMNLWGEVHRLSGDDAYSGIGAMLGFKYVW